MLPNHFNFSTILSGSVTEVFILTHDVCDSITEVSNYLQSRNGLFNCKTSTEVQKKFHCAPPVLEAYYILKVHNAHFNVASPVCAKCWILGQQCLIQGSQTLTNEEFFSD